MKRKIFSNPALLCALTALILATGALGPFMRETDQAWLLDGGMSIASGHPEIAQAEFNFDKQFVSYYLAGLLFIFLPRPFAADMLVLAANVLVMLMFWGGLCWLLARSAKKLPLALALPLILAPTFLVYSPFYASAFTSVAFVIYLAIFLARKNWSWPLHCVSFALAFCAVGARADAIFLLPLLAMLHSPQRTFVSVLKSPNTWLMAAGGLAAFFLGRALYLDHAIDYAAMQFRLKIYLGHVVFGLGGAALLLLLALHATLLGLRTARCKWWTVFLWLGLLLPMGYYSLQLLTPRHCTVGAVSILVFVCAARGRVIFQNYFRRNFLASTIKFALLLAALVPVFVGVNLVDLRHPKLTCTQPTLLPSGAGAFPAGGYLAFTLNVRRCGGFLDHNQAVWAAARDTKFSTDATGGVPYLFTPIESYLKFAIRLEGKIPQRHSLANGEIPPQFFYVESRSLMRFQFAWPPEKLSAEDFFKNYRLTPVTSQNWNGISMFHGEKNVGGPVDEWNAGLWALNQAFGRDEFRLGTVELLNKIPKDWLGRKVVVASRGKFLVAGEPSRTPIELTGAFGPWQIYEFSPQQTGELLHLTNTGSEQIFIGISAFPAWMSLQKL
jgi:hypothetical protein